MTGRRSGVRDHDQGGELPVALLWFGPENYEKNPAGPGLVETETRVYSVDKTNNVRGVVAMSSTSAKPSGTPESTPVATKSQAVEDGPTKSSTSDTPLKVAIWIYFSLLVAVLAAIGIQGDVLQRLIRNDPALFAWAVIATIIGAAVPVLIVSAPGAPSLSRFIGALGATLVVGGICWAVWLGAQSITDREAPSLDLTIVKVDNETVHVTAHASSTSLRTTETMLLRITAIRGDGISTTDPWELCASSARMMTTTDPSGWIVAWLETGPSTTGVADREWHADIDIKGVRYICAYTIPTPRNTQADSGGASDPTQHTPESVTGGRQSAVSIIDLQQLVVPAKP